MSRFLKLKVPNTDPYKISAKKNLSGSMTPLKIIYSNENYYVILVSIAIFFIKKDAEQLL